MKIVQVYNNDGKVEIYPIYITANLINTLHNINNHKMPLFPHFTRIPCFYKQDIWASYQLFH